MAHLQDALFIKQSGIDSLGQPLTHEKVAVAMPQIKRNAASSLLQMAQRLRKPLWWLLGPVIADPNVKDVTKQK